MSDQPVSPIPGPAAGESADGPAVVDPLRATGLLADLGATIPVVAAPMAGGPSTPELVIAAAEAGGIGFLAGGYKVPEQLAQQITEVRDKTPRFGVNLFAPNPVPVDGTEFTAYVEALRELASTYGISLDNVEAREDDDDWEAKIELLANDPVPIISFTFGLPSTEVVARLQQSGSLVLQTITNPQEAVQAAELGVDGLIVQSHRAGGHSGTLTPATPVQEIPLSELLAAVRAVVALPLWAAGGISTPEAAREALAAGAEAAVVGTVLLRSPESGASKTYQQALADPSRSETVSTTAFSGRPARALRNRFVDQFHPVAPAGYPALHHLTSPLRKFAAAAGDPEGINIWAGTGYRDATEEPATDILRRIAGTHGPPAEQRPGPSPPDIPHRPPHAVRRAADKDITMPLINIDLIQGRTTKELQVLLDTVHDAMVEAFDVPPTDRYQILTQHQPQEIVALDTGLGLTRSNDLVVLRFTSRHRPQQAKETLYRLLATQIEANCGINPDDLIVTITENDAADWSFGRGRAQFLTGEL